MCGDIFHSRSSVCYFCHFTVKNVDLAESVELYKGVTNDHLQPVPRCGRSDRLNMERSVAEELMRPERVQIMLNPEELKVIDDFRFHRRMPSRAAAVRELLKRGLAAEGFELAPAGTKSQSFGVIEPSTDNGTTDTRRKSRRDLAAD